MTSALLRQARFAQTLTAAWMVVELAVAVAAGIAARSVALTAFGLDSGIEIVTSLVVLRQLMLTGRGAPAADDARREALASYVVGVGLYALIGYILLVSGWTLLARSRPDASTAGLAITVAALVVMPVLWRWRLRLATRLDNAALRGDAACSVVCIYMALLLLGGLALNRLFGLWWADPIAALAMTWWIRGEAAEAMGAAAARLAGNE